MTGLAPNLFDRRFRDFVEIGRARVPSLAPEWTDHNAHDPGITLMELLAWVAEAQLYSVSRLRRDERTSYAALLGLAPGGTQGARGVIWSDRLDPSSPTATFAKTLVIPDGAVIHVSDAETPTFRPVQTLLWIPGRIQKLETRSASGRAIDHTVTNERGGPAFLPFGEAAGRRDVLAMTFASRDDAGLFGVDRKKASGALWAIGVRAAAPAGGAAVDAANAAKGRRTSLVATLVAGNERFPVRIASDTTQGLLTTGAVLLDLSQVTTSPGTFTLELASARGFARPPRVLRIEPNVVPVQQGLVITDELQVAMGLPDWSFTLRVPGLRFAAGEEPVRVDVADAGGRKSWKRCDRLIDRGPDELVYELDVAAGQITFGNGVNGRIPPADAQVLVSYAVSDGDQGVVARNRKWSVAGFAGTFGLNLDPITGGTLSAGWIAQRREARRRSKEEHALVSADDISAAAKALPLLEVARAWVVTPSPQTPRTGVVKLVAMRSRVEGIEPERVPETARWLESIRGRLVARMPLAVRLVVAAPRYVELSIQAAVEANPGLDPLQVKADVEKGLRKRLALVESADVTAPRQLGVPVTKRDVAAWIRATTGVRRVIELRLLDAGGNAIERMAVSHDGLPRWNPVRSTIDVNRPKTESRR